MLNDFVMEFKARLSFMQVTKKGIIGWEGGGWIHKVLVSKHFTYRTLSDSFKLLSSNLSSAGAIFILLAIDYCHYCQTRKSINVRNVFEMFIVLRSILLGIRTS